MPELSFSHNWRFTENTLKLKTSLRKKHSPYTGNQRSCRWISLVSSADCHFEFFLSLIFLIYNDILGRFSAPSLGSIFKYLSLLGFVSQFLHHLSHGIRNLNTQIIDILQTALTDLDEFADSHQSMKSGKPDIASVLCHLSKFRHNTCTDYFQRRQNQQWRV